MHPVSARIPPIIAIEMIETDPRSLNAARPGSEPVAHAPVRLEHLHLRDRPRARTTGRPGEPECPERTGRAGRSKAGADEVSLARYGERHRTDRRASASGDRFDGVATPERPCGVGSRIRDPQLLGHRLKRTQAEREDEDDRRSDDRELGGDAAPLGGRISTASHIDGESSPHEIGQYLPDLVSAEYDHEEPREPDSGHRCDGVLGCRRSPLV